MTHGDTVATALGMPPRSGIPWMVILDSAGKSRVTSDGPMGNVGYPLEPHEIAHFVTMLQKTARRLTAQQIGQVESLLNEAATAHRSPTDRAQGVPREPEPVKPDTSGFDVKLIVLYQDDQLIGRRVGPDIAAFSRYVNGLKAAAQNYWKGLAKQDGRTMMAIACMKPDRSPRFWFTFRGDELDEEVRDGLRKA